VSLPVSEQIDLNVIATLEGVTTAGGYAVTLTPVERFKVRGNATDHLKAVVCVGDDSALSDNDTPQYAQAWTRPYEIVVFVFEPEVTQVSFNTTCNLARASIEKALMQDITRGGLAQNTFIRDPQLFCKAIDASGITVRFDVQYRTQFDDPFTQR
jgi:hypothetical protein